MTSADSIDRGPDAEPESDFSDFYRDVEPRIRRALVAMCGVNGAVDATAVAMVLAYRRWDEISAMDNPAGYIYRVARNAARSRASRCPPSPPTRPSVTWTARPLDLLGERSDAAYADGTAVAVGHLHIWLMRDG